MSKNYSVSGTTRVQREKIANDAMAISILDAPMPTTETLKLVDEYVKGNMEIDDILSRTIEKYRVSV